MGRQNTKSLAKSTKYQNVRQLTRKNANMKRKNTVKPHTRRNALMRRRKNATPNIEQKPPMKRNKNAIPHIEKNASQTIITAKNVKRSQKKNAHTKMFQNTTRFQKRSVTRRPFPKCHN